MKDEDEKIFIDTNILVYAYDASAKEKHEKAKQILSECFEGIKEFYVSNQVLSEFIHVTQNKIEEPLPEGEIKEIINEIATIKSWKKINYSVQTLQKIFHEKGKHTWDKIIAATMKENNIQTIYTENIKHFKEMTGIKAINPLL